MTIGRRQAFGWGAFGLGALAIEGCSAGFGSKPGASMSADDVERLLTELDGVVAHLETLDADPKSFGIGGGGMEVKRGRDRCIGLLTTLCFMGTYRDIPEPVRAEPRVSAHLAKSLPRIEAVIESAREHLSSMTAAELASIDQRLVRNPELPMKIMERIDEYARDLQVPIEQRTYLRLSTAQLASRFRYEGTREVTTKLSSTYGRLVDAKLAELGIERRPSTIARHRSASDRSRPDLSNLLGAPKNRPRGEEGETCMSDRNCEGELVCVDGECKTDEEPKTKSKQLVDTAVDIAKVGAWLLIPPLCGIGVLVLLVSLFTVIVAGIVHTGEG